MFNRKDKTDGGREDRAWDEGIRKREKKNVEERKIKDGKCSREKDKN